MINCKVETPWAELAVRKIHDDGGTAFWLAADVTRQDEAEMLVDETVDRLGGLDILVNNAGIWERSPIDEMSNREWTGMLDVNLTGPFHIVRAAVPAMKEAATGSIINISSTAGQRGGGARRSTATTPPPRAA
jgi:NAD(P)-dependent dehydrogenase (short-subunit alcohol dehydrogenase family)